MDTDARTDEYYVTALQIFDYCGAESMGTLHVDALMDKFAPFVKTSKTEFSFLKSLLDPEESNPEIDVTQLADALNKYSENQKTKRDLDESFNLRGGQLPQDSDSGISTDGFQLLEELQCELREKAHLAHQLRSQLDFTDRQHEEVLTTLTAERDSLRTHLNMLREENISLCGARRDYDEACERLAASEQALVDARREHERAARSARVLAEQVAVLEAEKNQLEELLNKSKEECHRINEMYASRQSALLEHHETLRAERAELEVRLADSEGFVQQLIKEKVHLEMELKDVLNKSNQTHLRMDQSIDVSYTEDQMLTALDSLNVDSRFSQDHHLLEEESFLKALKDDERRSSTNMSLFDEIRLSFSKSNASELHFDNCLKYKENLNTSLTTTATQTDTNESYCYGNSFIVEFGKDLRLVAFDNQTDAVEMSNQNRLYVNNANSRGDCTHKCDECERLAICNINLENDFKQAKSVLSEMKIEFMKYEDNLNVLQKLLDEGNDRNSVLHAIVNSLQSKLIILEAACESQKVKIESLYAVTGSVECQTESGNFTYTRMYFR